MPGPARPLPDGLALRAATADDLEAILALLGSAFGADETPAAQVYLTGPGSRIDRWTVVVDADDRVLSTCVLLDLTLELDGVAFPAGQIEFVATLDAFRRRGLVREQFAWHHEQSAAAGHLAQFVGGIPYFYRRLGYGYGYGVSYPALFILEAARVPAPSDVHLRNATVADIGALQALEGARVPHGLRNQRNDTFWRRSIALAASGRRNGAQHGDERFFVAERAGEVVGWAAFTVEREDDRLLLLPAVAVDDGVTDAIARHALDQAEALGPNVVVIGHDTPGRHGVRLRDLGRPAPAGLEGLAIYVRIPDPVAFLDRLRPALDARLAASAFKAYDGEVVLSFYDSGAALDIEAGVVARVRSTPGVEDPLDTFGCGIAPDWVPALLLGRYGAADLARRVDDVSLGRQAALLEVLFPWRPSDTVGDF